MTTVIDARQRRPGRPPKTNNPRQEKQRQLQYWRRRLDLFMHMRYEFERLGEFYW